MNVVKDTASLAVTYSTTVMSDYQLTARIADAFVGSSTGARGFDGSDASPRGI